MIGAPTLFSRLQYATWCPLLFTMYPRAIGTGRSTTRAPVYRRGPGPPAASPCSLRWASGGVGHSARRLPRAPPPALPRAWGALPPSTPSSSAPLACGQGLHKRAYRPALVRAMRRAYMQICGKIGVDKYGLLCYYDGAQATTCRGVNDAPRVWWYPRGFSFIGRPRWLVPPRQVYIFYPAGALATVAPIPPRVCTAKTVRTGPPTH